MKDEKLEWKEEKRKEILKTVVFTVTERYSTGPDGQKGTYIVNEAPDWVIVIPVDGEDFLMLKQWRHGSKCLSIEFPGGVAEKGEDFEVSARRELEEETGAQAGKLTLLGEFSPNPALFANKVHVYCAEDLKFSGEQKLDADEFVSYMKISKREVYEKMGSAEFPHGLMLSALCLYLTKKANT